MRWQVMHLLNTFAPFSAFPSWADAKFADPTTAQATSARKATALMLIDSFDGVISNPEEMLG
jgi:hypothetical protein